MQVIDVRGVNGRHNITIILKFIEVLFRGRKGVVEWIYQRRIVGSERQFVDVV